MCMFIYICLSISADPLALGVSEMMVHPVPPNSPNAQKVQILRFSVSSDSSDSLDSQSD